MKRWFHCTLVVLLAGASLTTAAPGLAKSSKPVDWNKKLEKGYYELSIGNVDQAIDWFRAKVKSNPESGACHTALGTALKKKGRLQDAKNEFAAAASSEPTYANGFYELGSMQESDKEYSAASQSFEKYLQYSADTNKKKVVEDRLKFCKEHI